MLHKYWATVKMAVQIYFLRFDSRLPSFICIFIQPFLSIDAIPLYIPLCLTNFVVKYD